MAQNATSSDEIHSWNPAMRPDGDQGPVGTDSRDLVTDSKDDASDPLTLPSVPFAPAANIESPEDGAVTEVDASGDAQEQADSDETTDSGHALDTPVAPEPSKPQEDAKPDETATSVPGADPDETSHAVAEALAKEDGKAHFNEPEQQNQVEQDLFSQLAPEEPPAGLAVQEQTRAPESHDSAARVVDYEENQNPLTTNGEEGQAAATFWDNVVEGGGDGDEDFFSQLKTQTKPMFSPPDPDARFEEGMPLLSPQSPVEPFKPTVPEKAETQIDKIFDGDQDEGDDFFSQVQKAEPEPQFPPHITRKSTSQVMDSVGEALDSPVSESPSVQQFNGMLAAPSSNNHVNKVPSEEDLAARWQAELSDNEETQEPTSEELAARWQAELDDDDDLLMDDEAGEGTAGQEQRLQNINAPANYAPSGLNGPQSSAGPTVPSTTYTPHQPSTSDLVQGLPMQGAAQPNPPPASGLFAPQAPSRPEIIRAESFAERSKEGYQSPYDVPEGLARPRRPAKPVIAAPPMPATTNVPPTSNVPPTGSMPPPPPRTSSIPAPPPAASPIPPPPTGTSQIGAPPPAPKNFYEELPLPPPQPRSRPTSSGKYTPNPSTTTAPPPALGGISHPPPPPVNPYANVSQPPSEPQVPQQLQPPEQLDPYVNSLAPTAPAAPSASSRYSPKPPGLQAKPPSSPRYSPAPPPPSSGPRNNRYVAQPPNAPGQGASLPFQPRTSSPLAYHEKVSYQSEQPQRRGSLEPSASLSPPNRFQPRPSLEQSPPQISGPPDDFVHPGIANVEPPKDIPPQASPPRNVYAPPAYVNGFSDRIAPVNNGPTSFPVIETPDVGESQFVPPRRSQTQSPSQQLLGPKLSVPSIDPLQRPASVHGSGSPTKSVNPYAPAQVSASNRVTVEPLNFVPPTDEQQMDPLERWKGSPIISFGFGGTVTSCFPKHIPRYAAGQSAPLIKSIPGEVKICPLNELVPPVEGIVAHPGPLKSKSKKKDVLMWLSSKIAALENEGLPEVAGLHPDSHKRHDEKLLLWKIMRVLVESDGALEGSIDVQNSLRGVMFPHMQTAEVGQTYGNNFSAPLNVPSQPDAADSRSIDTLRDNLVLGDRERAVWGAVDNRLWGHAMIIASTMDKSIWKQVVQEFVRREVRSAAGNTESLAALYEIFAGNIEESVDELVPPSARAGLQMISKVNGQESSKNALDGLDSWKDTLGLVLSNRSAEDYQALVALGRLLLSYGRVEAAHICMIFSRAPVFGGADDPQANIVLLGADHGHYPSTFMHDEDAILLTEVYEFASSVLAASPQAALPHFMGFKLQYACSLAERGRKSEAQQYCDTITAALKATTRPSPYYHPHLLAAVDDLSARLRQTTGDGGSSWISRPSLEKVSGSMWNRFNSFVAGEDTDAGSSASGKGADVDVGPFAKVTGTPTVSRSPSNSDLYGSYPAAGAQPIPGSGPSRYHPSSQYAPNSSPEHFRGRSSMDSQRSFGFSGGRRGSQEPSTPTENNYYPGGSSYTSPMVGYQSTPPQSSYMPLAPVKEDLPLQPPRQPVSAPIPAAANGSPYQPSMYTPETYSQPFGNQGPMNEPQTGSFGYMPPATGGYGPPVQDSGAPFALEEEENVEVEKPKKPFMDDDSDDDMAARNAAIQKAERERQDREANEAFIKAAEADANKPAPKKSWFGSLFGGSKKEPDASPGGGPIRAKLGEQNSFYYDNDLKKWVNKKDPNSATPAAATPPPPRMGPSRTASGASIPPAATPPMASMASSAGSRPSSSAGAPPPIPGSPAPPPTLGVTPMAPPLPRSVSTGATAPTPPGSSDGLAPPPPRPSTSLSNASSIDDLLGAPTARKGGPARGKKKGRYVDVMAQ